MRDAVCEKFVRPWLSPAWRSRPLPADSATATADPLEIARILAARYPAQPIMSYIPALSWSGQLRLAALTGETKWREKALKDIEAFTSGRTPAIAEPYRLTSLAGALAFFDAAALAGDRTAGGLAGKIAHLLLPDAPGKYVNFATGWTDDMFMAGALLSRVGSGPHAWRSASTADGLREKVAATGRSVHTCGEWSARVGTRQRIRVARADGSAHPSACNVAGPRRSARHLPTSMWRAWPSISPMMAAGAR